MILRGPFQRVTPVGGPLVHSEGLRTLFLGERRGIDLSAGRRDRMSLRRSCSVNARLLACLVFRSGFACSSGDSTGDCLRRPCHFHP